jgi:glutamate dehydrogenase/leucine dehydrogenase
VGFEELLRGWDGEFAAVRHDAGSGTWMFVCVHASVDGAAGGGTRMRVYPRPADGLADAMRLSAAMTRKFAAIGLARGGGKAVLAVPALPEGVARRRLMLSYGDLVASLGGAFRAAGDMNVGPADLDVVEERCPWVYGSSARGGDSAPGTARGVLHGIRASVEHAFGSPSLAGRSVLVQGCGAVGARLARSLADEGAAVLVSDVDEERARATGFEVVPAGDALAAECDVYAPCAVGGTLDDDSIRRLDCRVVAGCANNQLAEPDDARRLHERGILYAPDYVINAGGVIALTGTVDEGWDDDELERNLAGIGETLRRIYAVAASEGIPPAEAADRLVEERLASRRRAA